jgi:tocopherol O-methyltransferase
VTVPEVQLVWTDLKARIQRHYDVAAPLYRTLWGLHVHHGYWQHETTTRKAAQDKLVEVLADAAEIGRGTRILDVGCGFGASARYLAQRFESKVIGINISQSQVQIAKSIVSGCDPLPHFVISDAEFPAIRTEVDVLWAVEAISHVTTKADCFDRLLKLLVPGGRVAVTDWFKAEGLDSYVESRYIQPIIEHMLVPELTTLNYYAITLERLGCRVLKVRDLSASVAKTWDVCLTFNQLPLVWNFARSHGSDFVSFLKGFQAMKEGFASGAFRYGMLIAEKAIV